MNGSRTIIIVFLILALSLNLAGIGKSSIVSLVKSSFLFVFSPVHWISHSSAGSLTQFFSFIKSAGELNRKNQELIQENDKLKAELLSCQSLRKENENLSLALTFAPSYRNEKLIPARVISRVYDLWSSQIIINRGKFHNVEKGYAVISSDGLVGRVVEVGSYSSKARLILDVESAVSVKSLKSEIIALAVGRGDNLLKLKYVPSGSKVVTGEELVVSPSSELSFGIPVGIISKIKESETALFQNIELTPKVDFSKLDIVYVVSGKG